MLESTLFIATEHAGPLALELYTTPAAQAFPDYSLLEAELYPKIRGILDEFMAIADAQGVFAGLGLNPEVHSLEADLTWVNNEEIQRLNRDYRDKDQPTDVLTFCMFVDSPMRQGLLGIPEVQLGSIFISLEWATNAVANPEESTNSADTVFSQYVAERIVHGLLHLLGVNHDTMSDYNRVVGIQRQVLHATF